MEFHENGPWRAGKTDDGRYFIGSDDFLMDVRLYVDGDFGDDSLREAYANEIAMRLNVYGKTGVGAVLSGRTGEWVVDTTDGMVYRVVMGPEMLCDKNGVPMIVYGYPGRPSFTMEAKEFSERFRPLPFNFFKGHVVPGSFNGEEKPSDV